MRVVLVLLLALAGAGPVSADELDGVYRRVSLTNARTGESPEAANREGLLIMTDGHYAMMTQNPDRPVLPEGQRPADLPQEQRLAYYEAWLDVNAHAGRYVADADTLTWYRDISENPGEVDTVVTLGYALDGDRLVLSFVLGNGDRYDWVWERVEPALPAP